MLRGESCPGQPERIRSMLRCASTWHRCSLAHPRRQPLPGLQSLATFRSSSTSFEEGVRSESSQLASSSKASSSGTARLPQEEKHDKTTTIHSSRSPNGVRTHPRALRPLLISPTFPSSIIPEIPISDPQPSRRQEETGEIDTPVTITLANLPPNTVKTDIRPVFQQYGEIQRIIMGPGGTRADIIYMDAEGVKRTLHAYAEEPFFVRGREVIMYRKCVHEANAGGRVGHDDQPKNTAWQADPSRARPDWGDNSGAIFVSQFPSGTTQDELWEAFSRFGKYERFVMRMYNTCITSLVRLLSGLNTQDPDRDMHISYIRAMDVSRKYYVLIDGYRSLSEGKAYVSSAL